MPVFRMFQEPLVEATLLILLTDCINKYVFMHVFRKCVCYLARDLLEVAFEMFQEWI